MPLAPEKMVWQECVDQAPEYRCGIGYIQLPEYKQGRDCGQGKGGQKKDIHRDRKIAGKQGNYFDEEEMEIVRGRKISHCKPGGCPEIVVVKIPAIIDDPLDQYAVDQRVASICKGDRQVSFPKL